MVDEELPYPPTSGKRIRTLNLDPAARAATSVDIPVSPQRLTPRRASKRNCFFAEHGIQTVVVERTVPPKSGLVVLRSPGPRTCCRHCHIPSSRTTASALTSLALQQHAATQRVDVWHCEWTPTPVHACGLSSGKRVVDCAQRRIGHLAALLRDGDKRAQALVHRPTMAHKFRRFEPTRSARRGPHDRGQRRGCSTASATEFGVEKVRGRGEWRSGYAIFPAIRSPRDQHNCCFSAASIGGRTSMACCSCSTKCFHGIREAVHRRRRSLRLVGRNPIDASSAVSPRQPGIEFPFGSVPDVRPFLATCGMLVVPLHASAAGSRLKDSRSGSAAGVPVNLHRVSAPEGLHLEPGIPISSVKSRELSPILGPAAFATRFATLHG